MMALVSEGDKKTLENISLAFKICLPDCKLETTDSGNKCPDIVIIDKDLPDCESFDVLKQVRTYSQVPIVFLSDVRDEPKTVKALEMGADEYIKSPSDSLNLWHM